jgi:hypothetical protein
MTVVEEETHMVSVALRAESELKCIDHGVLKARHIAMLQKEYPNIAMTRKTMLKSQIQVKTQVDQEYDHGQDIDINLDMKRNITTLLDTNLITTILILIKDIIIMMKKSEAEH